ncbi:MAG: YkgJ family cysteine cluster protein [Deltaproteobacteria bacterium]|uniref:YkgJ family cysteine cluster protein n=1 Tax=Candidatus Desulfacyla euxinica TaxID=2841693 RepID=A0A8J6N3P1_9DELT|nr:YkgJ family cysteine cluster protein [Candidatus Desulfacyla euxinica]
MFLDTPPPAEKQLGLTDTFSFSCHSRLSCFNLCCRNKYLPLTPYDIVRIRKALNIHSDDFLEKFTLYRLDPNSGFPILSIKMGDKDGLCPFVGPDGCTIYNDRPTACRLFPLGRSSGISGDGTAREEFLYLLDTQGCKGVKEKKVQSVKAWRDDQGLLPYIEMNDKMLGLLFHPNRDDSKHLDQRQQQKVMVACYNIDLFRDFVFKTGFTEQYKIDEETAKRVMESDVALLTLGFTYLDGTLFSL